MSSACASRPAVVVTASGCWEWQGARYSNGYGKVRVGSKWLRAHRVAYEREIGPIPEGLVLDHICCNRACVNPAHLEPVTSAENTRRGRRARLTAETAAEIRDAYRRGGVSQRQLARRYGVAQCAIHNVVAGKSWT